MVSGPVTQDAASGLGNRTSRVYALSCGTGSDAIVSNGMLRAQREWANAHENADNDAWLAFASGWQACIAAFRSYEAWLHGAGEENGQDGDVPMADVFFLEAHTVEEAIRKVEELP